MQNITSLNL